MPNNKTHGFQQKKQINEYSSPLGPGHLTGTNLKNIWRDVKDAFSLIGTVLKDIASSAIYLFNTVITVDSEKIKRIRKDFEYRKKRLTSDIDSKLQKVRKNMGPDFFPYMFLTRPAEYMAYIAATDPYLIPSLEGFLADIGIRDKDKARKVKPSRNKYEKLFNREPLSTSEYKSIQSEIQRALDRRFGISSGSDVSEGINLIRQMINEDKDIQNFQRDLETAIESSKNQFEDLLKDLDPKEIVGAGTFQELMNLKETELRTYVDVLNSPASFIAAIGKSKSLKDIQDALKLLSKTPYKLEGLGPEEEGKIIRQAKAMMKEIKEKGKTSEFLKSVGKEPSSEEDEDLLEASIEIITKNAISNLIEMFKNPEKTPEGRNFLKNEEEIKKEFIKEFTSDANEEALEFLKKQGGDAEKIARLIEDGVKLIQSSGLLGLKL